MNLASVKGLLFLEEGGVGLDCRRGGWSVHKKSGEWSRVDEGIPLRVETYFSMERETANRKH